MIFIGILAKVVDDFNIASWELQLEGAKAARELPGIVDQIITMNFLDFGDGKPPLRSLSVPRRILELPAKDRSGRLEQIEPPDLGKLLLKLTNK